MTVCRLDVDDTTLRDAWRHVHARDAADGIVSASVRRFAENADDLLERLQVELACGRYTPGDLTRVTIPKGVGGVRHLDVPSARDRIVERILSQMITPVIDEVLTPRAFAYRQGLSIEHAIDQLAAWRNEGYTTVVRADVDDCFPTVERLRLRRMLDALAFPPDVRHLIELMLDRSTRLAGGRTHQISGLAQGGSLSPVLSNLYLHHVDLGLIRYGTPHIRYADDLVVLVRDASEAQPALDELSRLVAQGGQRVGHDKTEVVTFADGFVFLGEEIGPRYPTSSPTQFRSEPERRTLHIGVQGAGVVIDRGRLKVLDDGDELLSVPITQVARIVLAGAVGLSAGARSWALANGIDVVLLSRRGSYLGRLSSASGASIDLRRRQLLLDRDDEVALGLARGCVHGKLSNMRTLLLRHAHGDGAADAVAAAEEIASYREVLRTATKSDQIMGVEGIASRAYWGGLRGLLPAELGFSGRHRRPAPDVVNAALGYGYAILRGDVEGAIATVGLDPSVGILHADSEGRPSLALDLMEEFRPTVVDQVVIEMVRRGSLTAGSSRTDPVRAGGVLLTEEARRALVAGIEDRLLTVFRHIPTGDRVTYRRSLVLQAHQVARVIEADDEARREHRYRPVLWR